MFGLANPARFLRFAQAVLPWAIAVTVLSLAAGTYYALFVSPADYQQGESVRIMYVHVPAAWMAMFCYIVLALASLFGLVWKHPLGDLVARAASPVGAVFTFLCLLSGSLWGKPMWGAWWVWDARLTSMLILLFLYLGHIALVNAFDDESRGAKAGAILALAGFINVPIIKFSVDWWNTLHQPASVVKMGGPSVHADMLIPLILMAIGFKGYFAVVVILRARGEIAAAKLRVLTMAQLHAAARAE